ncbi:aquaporin [Streptococcus azizii]|uniref:Aquaporin n=1 Tax=Streptococcus azizii TaxID=1579424 RepID=A0AB36JQG7_9STRE|nr:MULTISPECIES: aquaglyceroporin Gla [Streptococcus]MBF0775642.1 aquaporin family protein [Streptococcus sp. 19428wD3_AN2]ONK28556.1 aquaporin [Streptococcus azizii]ONK29251.1 aquaporin [Streptococcus azizii]ONK30241.1 aquaporin [Streptococcus azizii]TFU84189.1 aquaporin family protein [Streptococcus sp. AN2]
MDVAVHIKYITEFLATALLVILGNGTVANVDLKGTKGNNSGWILIAIGYGLAVMMPALMFGNVSGNHINPAFTLGLAVSGYFDWAMVPGYIAAQMLGAIAGQAVVVGIYRPYFVKTENPNHILGSFSTISALDDGTVASRKASWINGFLNEFFGSFVLFFGAMAITKHYFGAEVLDFVAKQGADLSDSAVKLQVSNFLNPGLNVAHLALGFLVMALVAAVGGPTGPALNPARDLGPRILHQLLPQSVLGQAKADSKWWYAWVPVVAPIIAGISAVALYKLIYG